METQIENYIDYLNSVKCEYNCILSERFEEDEPLFCGQTVYGCA